jgi:putative endopeptidase
VSSGILLDNQDPTVSPADDLFRHVNGHWLNTREIPPDRANDGSFWQLRENAQEQLRAIVEELGAGDTADDAEGRKLGDLYAGFMAADAVEAKGMAALDQWLARIDALASLDDLSELLGTFARDGVGGFFGLYVATDAKDSERYLVNLVQAGITLPDESYYAQDQYAPIRESYLAHVAAMFRLTGLTSGDGTAEAAVVMKGETAFAAHHWDRVRRRDVEAGYNLYRIAQLREGLPGFDVDRYLDALGAPAGSFDELVVRQPDFLPGAADVVASLELDEWKTLLRWQVVHEFAPLLGAELVEANFDFFGRTLSGVPELRDRWKRGVDLVERSMGEALGKRYVDRHFPPSAKARMDELVANLVKAYRQSITSLPWMGEETRLKAIAKLEKFTPKIAYPPKFRDYSTLVIDRDDVVGNVARASAFETDRELAKIGGPVDRDEWLMTPQTVNAYYNPGMNEIVFPAAILQPPFFFADGDDAVNYGGIGAVIGHEIGHGFDDQGSKYDGDGNLVDWWTEDDRTEFEKRTKALIAQYDELEPSNAPGKHVNGALTIGENIGDLGGLGIAFLAYELSRNGAAAEEMDGLTGAQRLFHGWAQVWCGKTRSEEQIRRLAIDPHSPDEFRCNQTARNLDEFHEAFGTTADNRMWLEPGDRVRIW